MEECVKNLSEGKEERFSCSRAYEQLSTLGLTSVDELLSLHECIDRHGNIDVLRCLQEQLKQYSHVEWLSDHTVIELLTLDRHSPKKGDHYKKPTCIGVIAYRHDTCKTEYFLAKETILATGGASSLFPYSIYPSSACGEAIAIAHRAGVRLLNMEQIQFHLLGLYEKNQPCFPLPLELLSAGGKLHGSKTEPLQFDLFETREALGLLYDQLMLGQSENLWLDLTAPEHASLRENFPVVDTYCLNRGFNMVKDPLPVVPVAAYTCGGIVVDKFAQTTLQRLRAVGGVACTGLFGNMRCEMLKTLESLVWAVACAEDILKGISKFAFYFPDLREEVLHWSDTSLVIKEDWSLLRHIMWSYAGIRRNHARVRRGAALLEQLGELNKSKEGSFASIEHIRLYNAIQTAQLILSPK